MYGVLIACYVNLCSTMCKLTSFFNYIFNPFQELVVDIYRISYTIEIVLILWVINYVIWTSCSGQ